ncbi:preprotein translocase subunit YajC [Methylocystis sp. SB2]|jgi:preprotein translocase subunit YajC|uniref:preprotein translocase subunit YajC n=1 Tax=Methylocystis sp. (strain SB2) TaxID=743836 RepID=UPI0004A3A1B8|nr:preprotein translocase subunit YajC [Methylocystis sp. SB2]ULO23855.1 preprotein translocase subunit YajC [Methylocystis sp. SB2]
MKLIPDALAQAQTPSPPAAESPASPPAQPTAPSTPASPTPPHPPTATQTGQAVETPPEAHQPPTMPEMLGQLIPIFVVMGIVYILVIRPRSRREKEQLAQLRNVRRGDTLVTTSGIVAKVTKSIDDAEIEVEIAPNVRVRMLRTAVAEVRAKGEPVRDETPPPAAKTGGAKSGGKSAKSAETKSSDVKSGNGKAGDSKPGDAGSGSQS